MRGSRVTDSHRARIGRVKKRQRQSVSPWLRQAPLPSGSRLSGWPIRCLVSLLFALPLCGPGIAHADPRAASMNSIRGRGASGAARANEAYSSAGRIRHARAGRHVSCGHDQPADHRAGWHRRAAAPAAAGGHRDVGGARCRTCSARLADQPVPDGGRARTHHSDCDDRRWPGHHSIRRHRCIWFRRRSSRRRRTRHHKSRNGARHPGGGGAHRARCIGRARPGRGNRRDPHRHRAECCRGAAGRGNRAWLRWRQGRRG